MSASEPLSKRVRAEVKADLGLESCPAGMCSPHLAEEVCVSHFSPHPAWDHQLPGASAVSWFPDLQGRAGVGRSRFTPGHLAQELPVTPASHWRC